MSAERESSVGLTGEVGDHYISTEPIISTGGISLDGSILERSIVPTSPFSRRSSRIGRRRLWRY